MTKSIFALSLVAALAAFPAHADDKHHAKPPAASGSSQASDMAEGEVRRVDKDAKKLTIKHGPLTKLDMPPMTMVFQVSDAAMLDKVKVGDKIRFDAEKVGGAYRITRIETAN
jgi:Cu(I)/Ag(I) efflux system periplasmic protein CusF